MKIEVSNGEILDKLSILNIKLLKINDISKNKNIANEQEYLQKICKELLILKDIIELFNELQRINLELWNIEDEIRKKEKDKEFDHNFIELARKIYILNDNRADVKKQINIISKSNFIEEKSYEKY